MFGYLGRLHRRWIGLSVFVAVCCLFTAGIACGGSDDAAETVAANGSEEAAEVEEITFALDFLIDGRYAPWILGKEKGFYEEAGFDITINPSKGAQEAMQQLGAGTAQAVFADLGLLVLNRVESDIPGKMVSVVYAKPPFALFTRQEDGISEPTELVGKTMGTNPGSPMPSIFEQLMEEEGQSADGFEWVEIDGSVKGQFLASGQVDAIDNYTLSEPALQRAAAEVGGVNEMRFSDLGLDIYANGIVFSDDYIAEKPEQVQKFIEASLRAIEYTLENPAEAAEIMTEFDSTLDAEIVEEQIAILAELFAPAAGLGPGEMDPEVVQRTVDSAQVTYDLDSVPAIEEIFTNEFNGSSEE